MTVLNLRTSLDTLSTDVHFSIAQFMEPFPDMHTLSLTCSSLRNVYQPLKWRYTMVTTRLPPKKYSRYMTVPLKVVVPHPRRYSWFCASNVHTLELDGLNLDVIQGSVEVLGKKWFVDKYYPELRRLQSSLTASSALLMLVPQNTPMFNPIIVGMDNSVGDGEIYIDSKRRCPTDDLGMLSHIGDFIQRVISGPNSKEDEYSPALRVDFATGRIIDFGFLQSIVVNIDMQTIPLLRMLFDTETTPINFPNLEEIELQCDIVIIYDEMKINPAIQFLENRKLPSTVVTCRLYLKYFVPYGHHENFLLIPNVSSNGNIDLPVTSFSYFFEHDSSRFFTRYRLPNLTSFQCPSGPGHWISERLVRAYRTKLTSVSFDLNAEDFRACVKALELIGSMNNLTKMQVKLNWFPTRESFLVSGVMWCVAQLNDDEQLELIQEGKVSDELLQNCTASLIQIASALYDEESNKFSVESAESICKTILSAVYDPSNEKISFTAEAEEFFFFDEPLRPLKDALDQLKITEVFYNTVINNLKTLEYFSVTNSLVFQCLPYSPRLHMLCRGVLTTQIKQILISLHTFSLALEKCFKYHRLLGSEPLDEPLDIFRLIVRVPNILYFSMPTTNSDQRFKRLEGVVDVENAQKIRRWDRTMKEIDMCVFKERIKFMVDTLLRKQFNGWV